MRHTAIGLIALLALACSDTRGPQTAVQRGERIYRSACTTCHALDPNEAGVLGPAIAGASLELLEAKVVRGKYPPGYTPERTTKQMPALPHLKDYIADLAAYLDSVKR